MSDPDRKTSASALEAFARMRERLQRGAGAIAAANRLEPSVRLARAIARATPSALTLAMRPYELRQERRRPGEVGSRSSIASEQARAAGVHGILDAAVRLARRADPRDALPGLHLPSAVRERVFALARTADGRASRAVAGLASAGASVSQLAPISALLGFAGVASGARAVMLAPAANPGSIARRAGSMRAIESGARFARALAGFGGDRDRAEREILGEPASRGAPQVTINFAPQVRVELGSRDGGLSHDEVSQAVAKALRAHADELHDLVLRVAITRERSEY